MRLTIYSIFPYLSLTRIVFYTLYVLLLQNTKKGQQIESRSKFSYR